MSTRCPVPHLNATYLVEVENQVQFTYISKVAVQNFDIAMDDFEGDELVSVIVDSRDKEKRSISARKL